ncbi:MAG: hypothetical protein KIS90_05730 [Phenylobacterium sp.]|nr:hypothetical protein [Phenylobacterium sp.]
MGDVPFKVGKANYILNMGVNAMCCLEQWIDETGWKVPPKPPEPGSELEPDAAEADAPVAAAPVEALEPSAYDFLEAAMASRRVSHIRVMLWAGLQQHHQGVDLADAGVIVQGLSMTEKVAIQYISESLTLCSPKRDKAADLIAGAGADASGDPPQA